jgi:ubiquinone/menaquinone biosynthesis C-methylase UbiE
LELGCGNGTYSKILSEEANQLTATDFSDEMVEDTTNRLVNFDNITIEKADCFNLHYEDSSFDTIFMANLLHIIPDPDKAIAECKRLLREDGRLIIVSFTAEGMTFINKLLMIIRYLKTYGRPSPFAQNLTISTTEEILVKNGFQPTQSKLLGKNMKAIFVTCCC